MPGIDRYRREGLCINCGKPPEPKRTKCRNCLDRSLERNQAWREQMRQEGKCTICGKPNDRLPKVICFSCTNKAKSVRVALKMKAFAAYGGAVCACCGERIPDFLTIDHIDGDGADHRRKIAAEPTPEGHTPLGRPKKGWDAPANGSGVQIYSWLQHHGYPPGFQVLCMNCNFAKSKFGSCPHTRPNPYDPSTQNMER